MADLTPVIAMMETIGDAVSKSTDKSRFMYVNKYEAGARRLTQDKFSWVLREEDFGMSPLVSELQASPVVAQGDYSQWVSSGLQTRHAKQFSRDQLKAILSPDTQYQVDAAYHIEKETAQQLTRVYTTQEFVFHKCLADGALTYVSNDANNRMSVSMTFPIKTKTASVLWSHVTSSAYDADVVTQVQGWLDEFQLSGQGKPEVMRMTTKVWRYLRENNVLKTYFANTRYTKGDVAGGTITRQMIQEALDWPTIEIYDERADLRFTSASTGAKNGSRVINLNEGTFGLRVGDTMLIGYSQGSWSNEAPITAITDGVSVTLTLPDADSAAIAVGTVLVARPTFHPSNKVVFLKGDAEMEMVRLPFGIEASGQDVRLVDKYGIEITAYEGSLEPDLVVYRRIRDKWGLRFNPRKVMSCTVL